MAKNVHKVPAKQWKRWGQFGQAQFNRTYRALMGARHMLFHPKTAPMPFKQFTTIAWNASWLAADEASAILKDCQRTGQLA